MAILRVVAKSQVANQKWMMEWKQYFLQRIQVKLIKQVLLRMVFAIPSLLLSEYARVMDERFGVKLSESNLSQFFAQREINSKKVLLTSILLTI